MCQSFVLMFVVLLLNFAIRGSHPWLTILLLPGLWACNTILWREIDGTFPGNFRNKSGNFLNFSRTFPGNSREISRIFSLYAQNLILVTLILVNFGGFWVIARNPPDGFRRNLVEILPTGLPELSKPSRDLLQLRKTEFF